MFLRALSESLMLYLWCRLLTGVSAPQREASMGVNTVLAKESFWRLAFECHLTYWPKERENIYGLGKYNRDIGVGCMPALLL